MKDLRKKVKQIESISSPVLKSLIESTIKNEKRKSKGRRWSKLNKIVALALYKKSPKAYRYLSQLLSMPSVRTLQTILETMKLEPGIDPNIITHLKSNAEKLKEDDKICVILFDEIALKRRLIYNISADKIDGYVDLGNEGGRSAKIADHALVFMLQGIRKKMKQPIAHYFVSGTIETEKLCVIIKTVIRMMTASGYKIIATVCDQGPTNVGALNLLKKFSPVSVESNYFLLDNEKVFIIYDVPHLFKSIRNNFLQAGELLMDGKTAKWQHLINLEEKNRTTLHFKKITKLHVAPKYRSKMRVKLAAQILSNTVAAVLKLQAESIQNKQESVAILQTAEVVELLDRLFDATNGPASNKDIKKNYRQNVSKNSFHHQFWQDCKQKLKTLQFLKSDSQIRLRNDNNEILFDFQEVVFSNQSVKVRSTDDIAAPTTSFEDNDHPVLHIPEIENLEDQDEEIKEMIETFMDKQDQEFKKYAKTLKETQQTNANIEHSLAFLTEQNDVLKRKIESLEVQMKEDKKYISILEDKIENMQMDSRKSNFEIKSVPKKDMETKEDLIDMVLNLSANIGGQLKKEDIKDIYRVAAHI
ncbi:uncharacterized protein LOC125491003 [Plutella xylostella]|uniref:uncharacterized protein LOC125491003 n=1 Tax=Plutella xylostella TaxID=51655 RepID=UPI002032E0F3|nr:uncharacterized protein LOC125491003 [Plutella xylostella]